MGCGSGQATCALAAFFDLVVGVDQSTEQLKHAKVPSADADMGAVKYVVGSAYDLQGVASSSADLVSCAQMAHWLELDRFFPEAARVLRPGGVLAILGYGACHLKLETQQASEAFERYYYETLGSNKQPGEPGCYWDCERALLDNAFQPLVDGDGFGPLFQRHNAPGPGRFQRHLFLKTVQQPVRDFIGYLRSWSAYRTFMQQAAQSGAPDPLLTLPQEMGFDTLDATISVTFPFFLLTAQKV